MTNFLYLLNLDNNAFHGQNDEIKDQAISVNYGNVMKQLSLVIESTKNFDERLSNKDLAEERIIANPRLDNGPRLYYLWLRFLSFKVAYDFLKDADSRKAYSTLFEKNAVNKNSKIIYEEKYIADLIKEFQILRGNKDFEELTAQEIIKPYLDDFGKLIQECSLSKEVAKEEIVQNVKEYVNSRIEAEIDINSHPEYQRYEKKEHSKGINTKIQVMPDKGVLSEVAIRPDFPDFSKAKKNLHRVVINEREYAFAEEDFPFEVVHNPNRLAFELFYNALYCYQNEINNTLLAKKPKKIADKIALSLKQIAAKFQKINYIMRYKDTEFRFDSSELRKYKSSNGQIEDMANLAFGKYINEVHPYFQYKTKDDFKNLLAGQIVNIDEAGNDAASILVFDHGLYENEFGNDKKTGYTRIAYEVFEKEQANRRRKKEGEQQKPKSIKQISPPVNTQTKKVSFTRSDDNREDFGEL